MLSTHLRSAPAPSIGQFSCGVTYLRVSWGAVRDWDRGNVEWEGLPWGSPPGVQRHPFHLLAFHRLEARPHLNFRRGTVPSFEVSEHLLDVTSSTLGFNSLSNPFGPCNAVGLERRPYCSLQAVVASAAQPASPTQHCPVGHQPPRLRGYPIVARMVLWILVDDCRLHFLKLTSHFVLLPRWERDGEALAVSSIGLEGPILPFPYVSNDRAMIRIVDRQGSEANLPEPRNAPLPSHAVIWLGVYPAPLTFLVPCPAFPSLLQAALPKCEFAGRVN